MAQQQPNQSGSYDVRMPDGTVIRVNNAPNPEAARARAAEFYSSRSDQPTPSQPAPEQQPEYNGPFYRNEGGQRMVSSPNAREFGRGVTERIEDIAPLVPDQISGGLGQYARANLVAGRTIANAAGNAVRGVAGLADRGLGAINTLARAPGALYEAATTGSTAPPPEDPRVLRLLTDELPVPETQGLGEQIGSMALQFGIPGLKGARAGAGAVTAARGLPTLSRAANETITQTVGRVGQNLAGSAARLPGAQSAGGVVGAAAADFAVANPEGQEDLTMVLASGEDATPMQRRLGVAGESLLLGGVLTALGFAAKPVARVLFGDLEDAMLSQRNVARRVAEQIVAGTEDRAGRLSSEELRRRAEIVADSIEEALRDAMDAGMPRNIPVTALLDDTYQPSRELLEQYPNLERSLQGVRNRMRSAARRVSGMTNSTQAAEDLNEAAYRNVEGTIRPEDVTSGNQGAVQGFAETRAATAANDLRSQANQVLGDAETTALRLQDEAAAAGRSGVQAAEEAAQQAQTNFGAVALGARNAPNSPSPAAASQDFTEQVLGAPGARSSAERGALGALETEQRRLYSIADNSSVKLTRRFSEDAARRARALLGDAEDGTPVRSFLGTGGSGSKQEVRSGLEAIIEAGENGRAVPLSTLSRLRLGVSGVESLASKSTDPADIQYASRIRELYDQLYDEAITDIMPRAKGVANSMYEAVRFSRNQLDPVRNPSSVPGFARQADSDAFDPGSTLGRFLGNVTQSGARVSPAQLDDLDRIINVAATEGGASREEMVGSVQSYLMQAFNDAAFSGGSSKFKADAADEFLQNNRRLLERFNIFDTLSEIRSRAGSSFEEMTQAQRGVVAAQSQAEQLANRARTQGNVAVRAADQEAARIGRRAEDFAAGRATAEDPTQFFVNDRATRSVRRLLNSKSELRPTLEAIEQIFKDEGADEARRGLRSAFADVLMDAVSRNTNDGTRALDVRAFSRMLEGATDGARLDELFEYAYTPEQRRAVRRYLPMLQRQMKASTARPSTLEEQRLKEGARDSYIILASLYGIVQARGMVTVASKLQRALFWDGGTLDQIVRKEMDRVFNDPEEMVRALRAAAGNRRAQEEQINLFESRIANNLLTNDAPEMEPSQ